MLRAGHISDWYVGAAVVAVAAVTAALIARRRRGAEIEVGVLRPALNEAA